MFCKRSKWVDVWNRLDVTDDSNTTMDVPNLVSRIKSLHRFAALVWRRIRLPFWLRWIWPAVSFQMEFPKNVLVHISSRYDILSVVYHGLIRAGVSRKTLRKWRHIYGKLFLSTSSRSQRRCLSSPGRNGWFPFILWQKTGRFLTISHHGLRRIRFRNNCLNSPSPTSTMISIKNDVQYPLWIVQKRRFLFFFFNWRIFDAFRSCCWAQKYITLYIFVILYVTSSFFYIIVHKSWVSFSLTLFSTSIKQSWYQSSVLFFTSKMKYWKHFKWKCSCTPWFFEWKLAVSQGKLYGLLLGQPQVVWGVDIQTGRSAHFYPGNPVFKRNSCLTLCKTYV